MKFQVAHSGYQHIRLKAPYALTLDIQAYYRSLLLKCPSITKIKFYADEKHFTLFIADEYEIKESTRQFLDLINANQIAALMILPIRTAETAYSIVTTNFIKHLLSKYLLPYPLRYIKTLYQAMQYWKLAKEALSDRQLNTDVLDATAILIAIATNQSKTASSMMFMLDLGTKLDTWSMKKSVHDLEMSLFAKDEDVWRIDGETRQSIKSSEVAVGDVLLVSEGNDILFDGIVVKGNGMVNESSLTGEDFPLEKAVNDSVFSNTILETGELQIRVTNNQRNARVQQLISLIKEAEFSKETKQRHFIQLADRVVKYNFLGALVTYVLTRSFTKAISFLLVDFSCALKISTPVAYLSTIKNALDQQVVIKHSDVLETYQDLDVFLFDKTGTITTSEPVVEKVITFEGFSQEDAVRISACLEEHIYHPIANAIVNKASNDGIVHEEMHDQLHYIASKGIKSAIKGDPVVIGNHLLMSEENVEISSEQQALIEQHKKEYNLLFLGYKQRLIAMFCIGTPLRKEASDVLLELQQRGKEVYLITGDTQERTAKIIEGLTFDKVYTELKPQDKYDIIKQLQQEGKRVLMIGDGLNDSAAISLADVGIVMNDSADISKHMSDIVLLDNDLYALIDLINLSDSLQQLINKNVKETFTINSSLIGMGLLNVLKPISLSILHNLTTLRIVLRSLSAGN